MSKKQAFTNRLYLFLLDGQLHEMSEAWEWITQAIDPQIAVRSYHRRKHVAGRGGHSLEQQIAEGVQAIVKSTLFAAKGVGTIEVAWPDPVKRDMTNNCKGFIDAQQAVVQLTQQGRDFILSGGRPGVWTRMMKEMMTAVRSGKVVVSVKPVD